MAAGLLLLLVLAFARSGPAADRSLDEPGTGAAPAPEATNVAEPAAPARADAPSRIAFGSCARQNLNQPIWDAIVDAKPDVFIFLGDNIYADTTDMKVMADKYAQLAAKPGFKALKDSGATILATWDDHDYGANDAGRDFPAKAGSEKLFLDFFEFPEDSPARSRPGVYSDHLLGTKDRRIQIILLDTRYFRSPLERNPSYDEGGQAYMPAEGKDATILGDAQWKWLQETLAQPCEIRVIGTSIQAIPAEHRWEKWANFPRERDRLFRMLTKAGGLAGATLLISGDRHLGEISALTMGENERFYEVTSSSLTNSGGSASEPNRYRVAGGNFRKNNFGFMEVDWEKREVALQLRDQSGEIVRELVVGF